MILKHPNPALHTKCKQVDYAGYGDSAIDRRIMTIIDTMKNELRKDRGNITGIGLAANQIGELDCIIICMGEVYINPEIVKVQGNLKTGIESCLSLPGKYVSVQRYQKIRIKAITEGGKPVKRFLRGLPAVCFQHEMDHLAGVLIIDKDV